MMIITIDIDVKELSDFIDIISHDKEDMRIFIEQLGKYFSKPVSKPIYIGIIDGVLRFYKSRKRGRRLLFSLNPHNLTLNEYGRMPNNAIKEEIKIFMRDNNIRKLLTNE